MGKKKSSLSIILFLCTAAVCAAVMYSLRYSFLSCSDSVSEFVYGRIYSFRYAYERALDFCLQRGRFGVIFPFVVALRFKILGTGSPWAAWGLQHIPIAVNVIFISVLIGKKAGKEYGALFALAFASLLQVNGWHSLITCYPLDFMYGLTLALIGFTLFQKSLEISGKKVWLLRVLSAFAFYESMQTYEAFLMLSLVYGWLSLREAVRERDGKSALTKLIKPVFSPLIIHIIVGVIFLALRVYVNDHPVVPTDDGVLDLREPGTAKGFLVTLGAFSGGMFPMADLVHPRVRTGITEYGVSWLQAVTAIIAGAGFAAFIASVSSREEDDKKRRDTDHALVTIGIAGLIAAIFFPFLHATTGVYQGWVVEGHQFGYVPTTISYFGWIAFIVCMLSLLLRKAKGINVLSVAVAGVVFSLLTVLTFGINNAIREEKIGPTNVSYSYKAQLFFAVAKDCVCPENGYDVIFIPDFEGVHDQYMFNELILSYEWEGKYDVTAVKSADEFVSGFDSYEDPGVIRYDPDSDTGIVCSIDSIDNGNFVTDGDIRVVSAHGGDYTITYVECDGDIRTCDFELEPFEGITFENTEGVPAYSIDIVRR